MTMKEFNETIFGTKCNAGTKKADALRRDYFYSVNQNITDVRDAYTTCSREKQTSFDRIKSRALAQGATCVYIYSSSCFSYATVYCFEVVDEETGELFYCYVKDTKDNTYYALLTY